VNQIVAVDLPSTVLARWKAVHLVGGNPTADHVGVELRDPNHSRRRIGYCAMYAKAQDLEPALDRNAPIVTALDLQFIRRYHIDLAVRVWIRPCVGCIDSHGADCQANLP